MGEPKDVCSEPDSKTGIVEFDLPARTREYRLYNVCRLISESQYPRCESERLAAGAHSAGVNRQRARSQRAYEPVHRGLQNETK